MRNTTQSFILLVISIFCLNELAGQVKFDEPFPIDTSILANSNPTTVRMNDLDNDGDLDLVVFFTNPHRISWYENDSNGIFGLEQIIASFPIAQSSTQGTWGQLDYLSCSDMDNDGDIDIVTKSGYRTIVYLENIGNAIFSTPLLIDSLYPYRINSIAALDCNNDGDKEILISITPPVPNGGNGPGQILLYENLGLGNYSSRILLDSLPILVSCAVAADIDNDGFQDVIACSNESSEIFWYENDGLGNFLSSQLIGLTSNFSGGDPPHRLLTADFDLDGLVDVAAIATLGFTKDGIYVFKNNGASGFSNQIKLGTSGNPGGMESADVNNDGYQDIVFVGARWTHDAGWYENDKNGSFKPLSKILNPSLTPIYQVSYGLATGDVNGDGLIEVAVANPQLYSSYPSSTIDLFTNDTKYQFLEEYAGNCMDSGYVIIKSELATSPFSYQLFLNNVLYQADSSTSNIDTLDGLITGDYICRLKDSLGIIDTMEIEIDGGSLLAQHDLFVGAGSISSLKTGLYNTLWFNYTNYESCVPVSGQAWFVVDSSYQIDSISIAPDNIVGDTLFWSFTNLTEDDGWIPIRIYVKVNNDPNLSSIIISAGVEPTVNDHNPSNNFKYTSLSVSNGYSFIIDNSTCYWGSDILGSFDPDNYPYYYSWANVDSSIIGLDTSFNTLFRIDSLAQGQWTVWLEDDVGNVYESNPLIMGSPPINQVDFSSSLNSGSTLPGTSSSMNIVCYNSHCTPSTGELVVTLSPSTVLDSASHAYTVISGNIVSFDIPSIQYGSNFEVTLHLSISASPLTSSLCFSTSVTADSIDVNPYNNNRNYCFGFAYDPNDKQVYPQGICNQNFVEIGDTLEYIIRYENTGSASTNDITILDTLSVNLENSSIKLVGASCYKTYIEIINDSVLQFKINCTLHPVGSSGTSDGFVLYKVTTKPNITNFDVVENSASIYFDSNAPIHTNSTLNTFISDLSILTNSTNAFASSCNPTDTGTVVTNHTNQYSCDSIHTIYTQLLPSDSTYATSNSCNPVDTGLIITTFVNQSGCDSIHSIYTSLLQSDSTFATSNSCNPIDTGLISTTLVNQAGCDSIHSIYTSLLPSDSTYALSASCNPSDTGLVTFSLSNQFACDSAHTIYTTLLPSDSTYATFTSCNPSDTGYVTFSLSNQQGCDSAHTVYTELLPKDSTYAAFTSCNPNDTGFNTLILVNQYGCDSLYSTHTSLLISDSIFINSSSCLTTDTGLYTQNLQNQFGCDSIVYNYVQLLPSYEAEIFDTIESGMNYMLPDGSSVNQGGMYSQNLFTNENCDSIILVNLHVDSTVSILGNDFLKTSFSVYPNPASSAFYIEAQEYSGQFEIEVYNSLGQLVFISDKNRESALINVELWNSGIYLIQINSANKELLKTLKIVVNR